MRERIIGHTATVNSIELIHAGAGLVNNSIEGCLLSASNDGTARVWDLRTSKGVILLNHTGEKQPIMKAKYLYGAKGVLTVSGNNVNLFDLRKPSLILS